MDSGRQPRGRIAGIRNEVVAARERADADDVRQDVVIKLHVGKTTSWADSTGSRFTSVFARLPTTLPENVQSLTVSWAPPTGCISPPPSPEPSELGRSALPAKPPTALLPKNVLLQMVGGTLRTAMYTAPPKASPPDPATEMSSPPEARSAPLPFPPVALLELKVVLRHSDQAGVGNRHRAPGRPAAGSTCRVNAIKRVAGRAGVAGRRFAGTEDGVRDGDGTPATISPPP